MAAPAIALIALGRLSIGHARSAFTGYAGAVAVLYMALARGFYWDLFGRGEGLFTANRITACSTLIALFIASKFVSTRVPRRTPSR